MRTKLRRYENVLGRLLVSGELSAGLVQRILRVVRNNGVALGVDHEGRISYTTYGLAEALGMEGQSGYDVLATWRRRGKGPPYSKAPGGKQTRVRYPVEWVWEWLLEGRVETGLGEEAVEVLEELLGSANEISSELGREFVEEAALRRCVELAKQALARRRG